MQGANQPFERLVYRPLPDETVRLANPRSGTLQLVDGVPPQAVAAPAREASVRVAQTPSLGFNAFAFNRTRAPLDDVRPRRAFTAAVDPEVVHGVVHFNTGRVARGPLSPAVGWAFDEGATGIKHDPAHAKELLRSAGAGDGDRHQLAPDGARRADPASPGRCRRVQG